MWRKELEKIIIGYAENQWIFSIYYGAELNFAIMTICHLCPIPAVYFSARRRLSIRYEENIYEETQETGQENL
jgi:hypothetical protein